MSRTADEVVKEGADFLDTKLPGLRGCPYQSRETSYVGS